MKLANEIRENREVREEKEKGIFIPLNLQFFAGEETEDDNGDDDDDEEGGKEKEDDDKGEEEKQFTQSQVSKMMTKEKKQGRKSLLKEFGFKDEKQAKEEIAKYNEWKKSQLTDEEKANQEKGELESKAAEALREAEIAKAEVEALKLGAKPDCVEDVIALAMSKMTEDADLKTVIAEIKTKHGSMFNDVGSEDEKEKRKKKGTGTSLNNLSNKVGKGGKDGEDDTPKNLGAKLAAKRNGTSSKKSYWS